MKYYECNSELCGGREFEPRSSHFSLFLLLCVTTAISAFVRKVFT